MNDLYVKNDIFQELRDCLFKIPHMLNILQTNFIYDDNH